MSFLPTLNARIIDLTDKIEKLETKLKQTGVQEGDRAHYKRELENLQDMLHSNKIMLGIILPGETQVIQ